MQVFLEWQQDWISKTSAHFGVQGWHSGESTRLPPMWPGFDSQTQRHMWAEFVGSLLCTERFFSSPQKPKFDLICINLLISIDSVPN